MRTARPFPLLVSILCVCGLAAGACFPSAHAQDRDTSSAPLPAPPISPPAPDTAGESDVPFVVTPRTTVEGMLDLANVTKRDTVYDLGSGDGRIPIMAAKKYGAYGVGIEIKPDLVQRARKNARLSGVSDKVEFRQQDLFKADFSDATVVTLYLLPDVNTRLRPKLFEQLDPGTRVVSHGFDMDAWTPDTTVTVDKTRVYRWTIPEEIPSHLKD